MKDRTFKILNTEKKGYDELKVKKISLKMEVNPRSNCITFKYSDFSFEFLLHQLQLTK